MKKRAITLLEVMIVILLIGLIGGVVSYNLKGSLEKGKRFRSKEGAQKLEDILNLELQSSSRWSVDDFMKSNPKREEKLAECIAHSGLVSNAKEFIRDGWGELYSIRARKKDQTVKVESLRLNAYNRENNIPIEDEECEAE